MPKTIILSFDDAVCNQRTYVAPILKELGFNATFFICRFPDAWRKDHGDTLMTPEQIKELSDMGFDIGNHTWDHSSATTSSTEDFCKDIDRMEDFLKAAGVPKAVSFAYPGGPYYTPQVMDALKERGFLCARSVAEAAFEPGKSNPMAFPAVALQDSNQQKFLKFIALCTEEQPLAILYHGVPDRVHPWVTQDPQVFRQNMQYLKDNGFRVISFRDFMTRG